MKKSPFKFVVLIILISSVFASTIDERLQKLIGFVKNFKDAANLGFLLVFEDEGGKHGSDLLANDFIAAIQTPVIFFSKNSTDHQLYLRLPKRFLSVVLYEDLNEDFLAVVGGSLLEMHTREIVFFSKRELVMQQDLQNLFVWASKQGLWRSVHLHVNPAGSLEVFVFNPYPEVTVSNITGLSLQNQFTSIQNYNFTGCTISLLFFAATPRGFTFKNRKGKVKVGGIGNEVHMEFLRRLKCTPRLEEYLGEETYERIYAGVYEGFLTPSTSKFKSNFRPVWPPLKIVPKCVVMPHAKILPRFMFLIKPFEGLVWISIFGIIIYISFAFYIVQYIRQGRSDFVKILMDVLLAIIFISVGKVVKLCGKLSDVMKIQVIILGFIWSNIYTAIIFQFRTLPIYEEQIKTLEDAYNRNISILISYSSLEDVRGIFGIEKYNSSTIVVEPRMICPSLLSIRRNVFVVDLDLVEVVQNQWKYSAEKPYWITDMCRQMHLSYYLNSTSIFIEQLGAFILQVLEGGLDKIWTLKAEMQMSEGGLLKVPRDETDHSPRSLKLVDDLLYLWILLGIGWVASILCFIVELCVFKKGKNKLFDWVHKTVARLY